VTYGLLSEDAIDIEDEGNLIVDERLIADLVTACRAVTGKSEKLLFLR
jgi:hypothetical protein